MKTFSLAQNWWQFVILAVVSYLAGCINFALIISRAKHKNITKMGSGNPGTMNMTREFGKRFGALTFIGDVLKGGLPTLAAYLIYKDLKFAGSEVLVADFTRYFAGLFVILGHVFPVMMKFKGGKGIASTFGVFLFGIPCENPWFHFITWSIMTVVLLEMLFIELGAFASLTGVSLFGILQAILFMLRYSSVTLDAYLVCIYLFVFAIVFIDWQAHRGNLLRLFSGEERRTHFLKKKKKS